MKAWITKITAVDPQTGYLKTFNGPPVYAETEEEASKMCSEIFPYAEVDSEDVDQRELAKKLFACH